MLFENLPEKIDLNGTVEHNLDLLGLTKETVRTKKVENMLMFDFKQFDQEMVKFVNRINLHEFQMVVDGELFQTQNINYITTDQRYANMFQIGVYEKAQMTG